jgi:acyl-CoA thioesterase FadM
VSDDDDIGERLVCRAPVRVRRRVIFGECDPAQVVYTPRFADYAVAAGGWFTRTVLNAEEPKLATLGIDTPMKAMSLEFHYPLRPDDIFDMTAFVRDIRTRTFELDIVAELNGTPVFNARIVPIMIDSKLFTSVEIPPQVRDRLERYRGLCVAHIG